MSDLSPQLKELVLATKSVARPSQADAARIFQALRARLGDATVLSNAPSQPATASGTSGVALGEVAAISMAGLALLGGLLFLASRKRPVVPSESQTVPSAESAISAKPVEASNASASALVSPQEMTPAPSASKPDRTDSRASGTRYARDSLSEEVAILSRAATELHNGSPESALKLLNEHERKFKNGILAEERIAARVQALCALGRTAEADAQFARLSPKSLQGERARQACGSRSAK
jgi:hypothetical protein